MSAVQRIQEALSISEAAGKVLVETMKREVDAPFEWADAPQTMDRLGLPSLEYRAAVMELEELGLVTTDTSLQNRSGYARTRLEPTGLLRHAGTLLPDVDVAAEIDAVLGALHETDEPKTIAQEVLEATGIPVGRFDLYVRSLRELDLLIGSGPASARYGSFLYLGLTDQGRKVATGEDRAPLP